MKRSKQIQIAALAILATLTPSIFSAEITVRDFTGVAPAPNPGPSYGFNGGPRGAQIPNSFEDNETEASSVGAIGGALATIRNQSWDMEGFSISGRTLYLVGGYDQDTGNAGYKKGSIFVKVGGGLPGFFPVTPSGDVSNAIYGYSYAIDPVTGVVSPLFSATDALAGNDVGTSMLNTAAFDTLGSNPWRVAPGTSLAAPTFVTSHSYVEGKTAAMVAATTGEANFASLRGDTGGDGATGALNLHNISTIDLTFLPAGQTLYFSYTMECGNDQIKGLISGGFLIVPDGGSSLLLLGLGLSGLVAASRRFRS